MKKKKQTILIAIDLDDTTLSRLEGSFPNLKYLADEVVLLYVFENLSRVSEKEKKRLIEMKKAQLSKLADDLHEQTGLETKSVLQMGKPADEILKAAESYNANLIAMSTHSRPEDNYTMTKPLGTTTNRVVRESKIPVFTFNSNVKLRPIKNILLPLDLSVETKQKVTNAISMAKRLGATIHVASVWYDTRYDDIKEGLLGQMNSVKAFIEEGGVKCTAELIETDGGNKSLVPTLLNYAEEINADLIMIMTQQENKLMEFFLGSSAQSIIRFSKIPVMSVIPKDLGFVVGL